MGNYNIVENYRDDRVLRNKFNEFVSTVFAGLNFEEWYETGYWTDKYIPYSILINNKIVSNVSISKMNICIEGKSVCGIQFGTVGTITEYRKQGLSKYLMDYVLAKYEDSTDLFFLFANDSVLDFYPKFGFERTTEYLFELNSDIPKSKFTAKKLDIHKKSNFVLIEELLRTRRLITKLFGAADYDFITMWHFINVFPDNIFYLEDENIIVICTIEENQMHIWDMIYSKEFNLYQSLSKVLPNDNVNLIYFLFPPDQVNFKYDKVIEDKDSMFFIRGNFPLIGKNFKFPTTAQT